MKKGMWLGLSVLGLIIITLVIFMPAPSQMTHGHFGLLMLALIVAAIMLGFPTAFTLMGLGMMFGFYFYASTDPTTSIGQNKIFDLMVQRTYGVMTNEVLISVPLFVFMGYIVERANIIDKLFKSLQLAMGKLPGSLAVATIITCAIFATATGIVGAVVTLMGLLALPAMLRAGYDTKLSAGSITAGGCLGILIPPSVLLILYGATAGVSVVKLYAGALFPGIMLAALYVVYVMVRAIINPKLAPPPPDEIIEQPGWAKKITATYSHNFSLALLLASLDLIRAQLFRKDVRVKELLFRDVTKNLMVNLAPVLLLAACLFFTWQIFHKPIDEVVTQPTIEQSTVVAPEIPPLDSPDPEPAEPQEMGVESTEEPQALGDGSLVNGTAVIDEIEDTSGQGIEVKATTIDKEFLVYFIVIVAIILISLLFYYRRLSYRGFYIFRMLLISFFPLAFLILAVLGSIMFGLATPSEAAAIGSLGGLLLAIAYRQLTFTRLKESVFLTARTSAMVCWLFVGSALFSATFALLGGQELIEKWVLSLNMTPFQFMLLSQAIIFLLGWPLEWTEIIVIFMPIFLPLLSHFNIDPLFFGLMVALNLQTAFLSPPVAMAAFYLKGVAPPHVTLNQIFAGMMPFMAIQVLAMALLYMWPQIGLWLPSYLYK